MKSRLCLSSFILLYLSASSVVNADELQAREYSIVLDERYSYECNLEMVARWAYITDVNNETAASLSNEADVAYFSFQAEAAANVSTYDYNSFSDVELYREYRFQADQGPGGLTPDKLTQYQELQSGMENIYNTATICPYNGSLTDPCDLLLEPDLINIMASSTDFDELKWVWEQWREVSGRLMRDNYTEFVALSNEAASLDGYKDTGDYWLNGYTVTQKEVDGYGSGTALTTVDQDAFRVMTGKVFDQVSEELYKPLHAFVRMKLKELYPAYIDLAGPIPANILGNMWAQDWTNVAEYVMPFPDQPNFDVTQSMVDNGWNIDMMFKAAEDFFKSIGLFPMTDDFWNKSVINQTAWGKAIECHASAEDFCLGPNSTDFRIKMCTQVNMGDLVTVHHEMGHIEYFMAYENLPHVFRDSANPGFHEAIGDLIALSVSTPGHMENILNLTTSRTTGDVAAAVIGNYTIEEQQDLNFLMRMALEKIAFLPFGYLIDEYRWGIFNGSIASDEYNAKWWELREALQGVTPPSLETRGEVYFDAGAKFHVPANVPYIRYFVSFIVQFQFQKRLCEAANFTGPLHHCDIYNNTDAGNILRDSLDKGFSEPWPLILEELGNSYDMDAGPIIEYFQPLIDYLNDALEGQFIGWSGENDNTLANETLSQMEKNVTEYLVAAVDASWLYYTNVSNENEVAMNKALLEFGNDYQQWWTSSISGYDTSTIDDPFISRQFDLLQSIGVSILNQSDLEELNQHISSMLNLLTENVCDYDDMKCKERDGFSINELEVEMGQNRDYSQLLYYWDKWRSNSARKMLDDFTPYVELMNKAAELNGFNNTGEMWLQPYTNGDAYSVEDFKAELEEIIKQLQEFYELLHGYVRYILKGNDGFKKYFSNSDDLIPAQILGNMYSESWVQIYNDVVPFPEVELIDITEILQNTVPENATVMFKIAADFYKSLQMPDFTEDFWSNSLMTEKFYPDVICQASAWDFYSPATPQNDGRFRIKMCTDPIQEDFLLIHREMGRTQYQMAYSGMPLIYRNGANPGFLEAVGGTIELSAATPTHLTMVAEWLNSTFPPKPAKQISRESNYTKDEMLAINFLMKQALDKVAPLPFAYILDQWRWELFEERYDSSYNKRWWEKRIDYQGVRPPVGRTADNDFDVGAKYHIAANAPYIGSFVGTILQFQFHQKLCAVASFVGPIYYCDIYNSKEAGAALMSLLSKGASEPWQDQLATFLGTEGKMDIQSLLAYFETLIEYLNKTQQETGFTVGWPQSADVIDDYIVKSQDISAAVPIIVGGVLAVLVCIVIIAFFLGQRNRKKIEAKMELENDLEKQKGNTTAITVKEKTDTEKEKKHVIKDGESLGGEINEGLELEEK